MTDTFFNVPAEKQVRAVALQLRQADGSFVEPPPQLMKPVKFFSGGGGLYSTAGDYLKFERMVLNGGTFGGKRINEAATAEIYTLSLHDALPISADGSFVEPPP